MTSILAIDPGPEFSAWVEYRDGLPVNFGKDPDAAVLALTAVSTADVLAIEGIASYGMAVGAEVFETCVWTGRFMQRWIDARDRMPMCPVRCIYRKDVKLHLCGTSQAKDSNIRQALIDRYGPGRDKAIGRKKTPGPLYGISADVWSALAVAVTVADTLNEGGAPTQDAPPEHHETTGPLLATRKDTR